MKDTLKPGVTVLADEPGAPWVKYIHGERGQGTWTFMGGHDPEDPQHQIGDSPTDLSTHPHSPGYRLILNNVLFPAAKKKELKTCGRVMPPTTGKALPPARGPSASPSTARPAGSRACGGCA